jgi:hypothetical protein
MTASDHLQPKQFYHGSNHEFEEGHHILPQSATGNRNYGFNGDRAQHVYVTTSRAVGRSYGSHLYEVEPNGPLHEDIAEEDSYMAPSAVVKRKVKFGDR